MPTEKFTLQQRIFMYDMYIVTDSCRQVCSQFANEFPCIQPPNRGTVRNLVNRLRETGSLNSKIRRPKRRVLTEEKLDDIAASLKRSPDKSLCRVAQEVGVSKTSAHTATKLLMLKQSHNVKVCDIDDDVKEALKKFRFRKNDTNAALIMKVDREKQKICIDDLMEDVSLDDLRESLPGHQPRFVVYSYRMEHGDGRVSFPMCFIYITPRDSQMELQIMYAGTKLALQKEADLTRVYEVRELDELTEEWLQEKLCK